jgi:hypothetical protein
MAADDILPDLRRLGAAQCSPQEAAGWLHVHHGVPYADTVARIVTGDLRDEYDAACRCGVAAVRMELRSQVNACERHAGARIAACARFLDRVDAGPEDADLMALRRAVAAMTPAERHDLLHGEAERDEA